MIRTQKEKIHIFLFFFAITFICLIWMRFESVNKSVINYTDCSSNCFNLIVPTYDAGIFGFLIGIVGISQLSQRYLKYFLSSIGIFTLTIYCIDLFVFLLLHHRLNIPDIIRYSGEVKLNGTVAGPKVFSSSGLTLIGLFTLSTITFLKIVLTKKNNNNLAAMLLVAAPLLFALRFLPEDYSHVSSNLYKDVVTNNLPDGIDAPFSESFLTTLEKKSKPSSICTPSDHDPQPLILLVVESLSVYQSKYLSGINNYTPELDKIIQKYSHIDNFYANGFTTDGGLIALLTGKVPLPNINRYSSTNAYLGYEKSEQNPIERALQKNITVNYFRSADQGFLNTGNWLRKIKFPYVEGPENPYYHGMARGSFNEPGDAALYQRYIQWYDKERGNKVFFSVIQTTTTHPPFVIPGSEDRGEEAAFRYADKELSKFIHALENREFFKEGTLIITGDHRSMTAQRPGEMESIGPDAHARVPAIIISAKHKGLGVIRGSWQQKDFIPSLLSTMGLESCTSNFDGRFLGAMKEPKYIIHVQGMERDRLLVRIKGQKTPFKIQMDGDRTRWYGAAPPDGQNNEVIDEVNRQRSLLPKSERDLAAGLLRWHGLTD